MRIVKIKNLLKEDGVADYKGLDISMNVPGLQLYSKDLQNAYIVTNQEEIPENDDLTEITQGEYDAFKQSLLGEQENSGPTVEERLAASEAKNDELTQAVADLTMTLAAVMAG